MCVTLIHQKRDVSAPIHQISDVGKSLRNTAPAPGSVEPGSHIYEGIPNLSLFYHSDISYQKHQPSRAKQNTWRFARVAGRGAGR